MLVVRKASKSVRGPFFINPYLAIFLITDIWQRALHLARHTQASVASQLGRWQRSTRGLATPSGGPYDAVVIGGGASSPHIEYLNWSVIVIAGPGGYVAAIKAAQLGLKVRSAYFYYLRPFSDPNLIHAFSPRLHV